MKTRTSYRRCLAAGLLAAVVSVFPGLVEADVFVTSSETWTGTYLGTYVSAGEDVYVQGATTTLTLSGNGQTTSGNWYVNGSTITSTYANNAAKVTPDYNFGTGTLYLTNSTLSAGANWMNVSAPIVVSGNTTINGGSQEIYLWGNLSGSGTITEDLGWSIYLRGDNSAYTGDWILQKDYTWLYNSSATAQAGWAGGGDYTFGSGTITVNGGMFALGTGNAYIYNDIILSTAGSVFSKAGTSLTLLGDLSGAATFKTTSASTPLTNLRGDNSNFTGAWSLLDRYVATDNTSATKVVNLASAQADSRFGTGVITLNGGGLQGDMNGTDTSVYIHNDITVGAAGGNFKATPGVTLNLTGPITATGPIAATDTGTLNISGPLSSSSSIGNTSSGQINITGPITAQAGFALGSTGSGKMVIDSGLAATVPITVSGNNAITLNGALTGSADITVTGGRFRPFGTTTGYSGDWHINGGKVVVNGGNGTGTSFGTGTVYLEGNGAAIVGFTSNPSYSRASAYVSNAIVVSGKNYLRSDGDPETYTNGTNTVTGNYTVTLNGPISSTDPSAMLIREGGGYRWDLSGANAGYQGNWLVKSDYFQTNNTTATAGNDAATQTDARFGSGTIYLQSGGIQANGGGVVYSDVTVQSGNSGFVRNSDFSLYGTVTADGTFSTSTNANADEFKIYGTLQGKGTVRYATVTVKNDGLLDPGQLGVVYYNESLHTYAPQADDLTARLTINGNLAVDAGGLLNFDVLSPTDFDSLDVNPASVTYSGTTYNFNGDVDLSNATIQVTFGEDFDWVTHYAMDALLIDAPGKVTGLETATIQYVLEPGGTPVASLPDTAIGGLYLTDQGVVLAFQTVPEPSTLAMLLGLGAAGLLGWIRRRRS